MNRLPTGMGNRESGIGRQAVAVALMLALTGCAVGPAYHAPRFDLAPRFREAPDTAGPPATAPSAFWQSLGDTTLNRLIGQALDANRDIQAARARVRAARATRLNAALDLAPALTAFGSYSRQRSAAATVPGATGALPDQGFWDAGAQLSWEVDIYGRLDRKSVV